MAAAQAPFRGRARERRTLERLLDEVRGGASAALVIRGEAGIGKTALVHHCLRQASGFRTLRITGVEPELDLPFAALHQLCLPMLDDVAALPQPQADALRVAFGLAPGSTPDRFLVGLAVLTLLANAAADRPLICVVDDAQWVDEPTAQVLGFVARRLVAEPILMLFAVRQVNGEQTLAGLPDLVLDGLTDDDARGLLAAAIPGHLDDKVLDRIIAETHGNPLGLLELARGISKGELAGGFAAPSPSPLSSRLHDRYVSRIRALPEQTQQLMLLAAADPTGDATLLWRAANSLGVETEAATTAHDEQLFEISARVRFRHPLVRSAAYAAGSTEARSAAHLALAHATNEQTDAERRLWHLAAAATGPDEDVATALERMSSAAQSRAGLAAAAVFLERSLQLTADPARAADRALAAATAKLHAGALDAARRLVAIAAAARLNDLQRVRVEQLAGEIEAASGPASEASLHLLKAAKALENLDVEVARETYLHAWWPAILAGRFAAPGGTLVDVCRAAIAAPRPRVARSCDLLLDCLSSAVVEGRRAAAPQLRSAVDLFMTNRASEEDWIRWPRLATSAAYLLWDFTSWAELGARQIARARESGALTLLVLALSLQARVATLRGELDAATALVAEANSVKEVTGVQLAPYGSLLLVAYQGQPTALAALEDEPIGPADGYALESIALARAVMNNGLRHYPEALEAAANASRLSAFGQEALPELVEAAVRAGQPDLGRRALSRLSELVVPESDWALGVEARCRALLEQGEAAERCYRLAIECLDRTPLRLDTARARLLYGEWLRRESRRSDSRDQLRRAYETFRAAGAEAFAERARAELAATGETVRRRDVTTQHELTPQEEHIARLARDGRSNPEIAAELFISPRTVEWHLRKVFAKLGVTSRAGLRDALSPVSER